MSRLQSRCLFGLALLLSGGGAAEAAESVPLFTDLGALCHPITTTSEQAQHYFDQGLRLVYAFNHEEAISFV